MPTPCRRLLPLLLPLALCWLADSAYAEDIVFPPDAGVVDVTKSPYFARGDGVTDDTEALQQALLERGGNNRIIYLPNGTYRLSGTLRWPGGEGDNETGATILQGQSREKTVIQLLDHTGAFNNSGKPRPMVWTGAGGQQHYRNAVRNLTLHTGKGNVGAIGLQFIANKQGCVRDVDIIAGGTGAGAIGLDLSYIENIGPLLVKGVRIHGFDSAIRTGNPVLSATFDDLEFTGQKLVGLRNSAQVISLRRLRSTNGVPALQNTDSLGFVTLLAATLQGLPTRRPGPALVNRGLLFARNVETPGYTNAVENRSGHAEGAPGPEVQEYSSHNIFTVFAAPPFSLGLPIEETPELPWDPPAAWAGPQSYGGKPDDKLDDSAAIQAAVNSGATTVYLPNGTWIIRKTVELGPKVRRLLGCEAHLVIATPPGQPAFRIGADSPETVLVERLEVDGLKSPLLELAAAKRVVFSSCFGVSLNWKANGTVFLEDVASFTPWKMGTNQTLWARQWCLDFDGPKLDNAGGTAWIFGLMTQKAGTLITTTGGGKSEVLGGLCLASGGYKGNLPMFSVVDAAGTFILAESSFSGSPYQTIVEETRGGVTRRMSSFGTAGNQTLPLRVGGIALPLFTAYNGVGAVEPRTTPNKPKTPR